MTGRIVSLTPVFLFSLPRSGSTLLQRLLGAHHRVATTAEPWLLLPFFYARRRDGLYAEYNHHAATRAYRDFAETLPRGEEDYEAALHDFALTLYRQAAGETATHFLDKTPRYHLICKHIMRAFPEAKFIFLWRNPLAVMASMIETWGQGKWNLYGYKVDLFKGLERLTDAYRDTQRDVYSLRYEDLVRAPTEETEKLFDYLRISADASVVNAFDHVDFEGQMGDQTGTQRYQCVSNASLHKWKTTFHNPLRQWWAARYLRWVGPERLRTMGYQLDDLLGSLDGVETRWEKAFSDLVRMGAGVLYPWVEPNMFRHKWRRRRQTNDRVTVMHR